MAFPGHVADGHPRAPLHTAVPRNSEPGPRGLGWMVG